MVGAGAVGALLAGRLAAGGHEVTVLRRARDGDAERRSPGRIIESSADGGASTAGVTIASSVEGIVPPPELILFAVKQLDLASASDACAAWEHATCLTVQNGIGAEELVAERRPAAAIVAASLTTAVGRGPAPADGDLIRVERFTRGGIGLAPVRGDVGAVIDDLVRSLQGAGLPAQHHPNAVAMKWSKLLLNLLGNASAALLDAEPSVLYRDARLFSVERRQLREALDVMEHLGVSPVSLPGGDARLLAGLMRLPALVARPALAVAVGRGRGGKLSSLRAHLRSGGGPSEIAWLNGAVARHGRELDIPTPVNTALARLFAEAAGDPARRAWFVGRPDRLLEGLGMAPGREGRVGA